MKLHFEVKSIKVISEVNRDVICIESTLPDPFDPEKRARLFIYTRKGQGQKFIDLHLRSADLTRN